MQLSPLTLTGNDGSEALSVYDMLIFLPPFAARTLGIRQQSFLSSFFLLREIEGSSSSPGTLGILNGCRFVNNVLCADFLSLSLSLCLSLSLSVCLCLCLCPSLPPYPTSLSVSPPPPPGPPFSLLLLFISSPSPPSSFRFHVCSHTSRSTFRRLTVDAIDGWMRVLV